MASRAVLADDMTGAGDSGIHFAQAGQRTALLFDRAALTEALASHYVAAVSSESRFLSPDRAAEAVRETAGQCRRAGARVVFKKVDSTLRGNPGAEIEAMLAVGGHDAALVCVAMPKTGRTCRDGVLLVHGKPVNETEGARDPFNPVTFSSVTDILSAQTALPAGRIALDTVRAGGDALRAAVADMAASGKRILVADAETDGDLALLGQLLRDFEEADGRDAQPSLLPVGAGGLAEAYAGKKRIHSLPEPGGRMLAVIGSLTEVSLAQIRCAEESGGFHVLELDMTAAFRDPGAEIARLAAEAAGAETRHLLLKNRSLPPAAGKGIDPSDGVRASRIFGDAARTLCRAGGCSTVYVTGGSTAAAAAAAFGIRYLTLERECLPGVVLGSCSCAEGNPRRFISKAGGFGGPDTLVKLAAGFARQADK